MNKAMDIKEFWSKVHNEVIYLYDDFYKNAFKVDNKNNKAYAKRKSGKEFPVDLDSEKMEYSMTPDNLVTKEFYETF